MFHFYARPTQQDIRRNVLNAQTLAVNANLANLPLVSVALTA